MESLLLSCGAFFIPYNVPIYPALSRKFGVTKVRYRAMGKNHQWLCAAFAMVNLYQQRNRLAPQRV